MRTTPKVLGILAVPLLLVGARTAGGDAGVRSATGGRPIAPRDAAALFLRQPAAFDANEGQFDDAVRFAAHAGGVAALFLDGETVLALGTDDPGVEAPSPRPHPATKSGGIVRLRYGAASSPRGEERLAGRTSYYAGNDPSRWREDVASYARARYESVAPGLDVVWRGTRSALEYDVVVAPGADPSAFAMDVQGAASLAVDAASGDLVIRTAAGAELRHSRPRCSQVVGGVRREPSARFVVEGTRVGFAVTGWDSSRELVIDPQIDYGTFLGGSSQDWAWSVAVGPTGDIYLGGQTSSTNFPVAAAYQATRSGFFSNVDAFVTRLKSDGTGLVFSTYLGGWNNDYVEAIDVDPTGAVSFAGYSASNNFPTKSAAQSNYGGGNADGLAGKLAAAGTLTYSTYVGGSATDYCWAIAVDPTGAAYVGGESSSTNFPTTSGARQTATGGGTWDGTLTKIGASGGALVYSTYHGGSGSDGVYSCAVDSSGQALVGGYTTSAVGLPLNNAYQSGYGGGQDGFVAKYNAQGKALVFGTYLGGSGDDQVQQVAFDATGAVLVCGSSTSTDLPLASPYQNHNAGGTDGFVTRFQSTGASTTFSTYLGGSGSDTAYSVVPDRTGQGFFVLGTTNSADFPTSFPMQSANAGANDGFIVRFQQGSTTPVYSTYYGGSSEDDFYHGALDLSGNLVVAGATYSSNFPVKNGYQASFGGGSGDAFAVRIKPKTPNAPANLAAVLQGSPVVAHLTWTDLSTDEQGFLLERKIGTGAFTSYRTLPPNTSTYDDTSLASTTTYTYRVTATGPEGNSAPTNEAQVTTGNLGGYPPLPKAPDGLTAVVVSPTEVDLSWNDNSDDEVRFEVQRQVGGAAFATRGTPDQDSTSFVDDTAPSGWPVAYRVRALAVQGPSAFTPAVVVTPPATLTATTTSGLLADSAKAKGDKLKWSATLAPADGSAPLDPRASGLRFQLGSAATPVAVTIAADDPAWKVNSKKTIFKWASAKGVVPKTSVVVNVAKHTLAVSCSGFDFSAAPDGSVRLLLAIGDAGGGGTASWKPTKPGQFKP
jgi:hypothetical protein